MLLKHSLVEEALTLAAPRKRWGVVGASAPGPQPYRRRREQQPLGVARVSLFHPFPSPPHHLCSGFWLVVHRCSSCGMQLSWPCIGSRTELRCQDSHRNLDSKLLLDGDTWENVGGKRYLMDRESGWPIKFCTTIQLGQLCFINQDIL